jgi:glycerol-3-phosphate O-acyltransferase
VISSRRVSDAIELASTSGRMSIKYEQLRAGQLFDEMAAAIRVPAVKSLGYITRKLWKKIYRGGIFVNTAAMKKVSQTL